MTTWTENRKKFTENDLKQTSPQKRKNESRSHEDKQWKNPRRLQVSKTTLGQTSLIIVTQIFMRRLDTIIKHIPNEDRNAFYMCKEATLSLHALLHIERPFKHAILKTAHADRPTKASLALHAQAYRQAHEREGESRKRISIKLPRGRREEKNYTISHDERGSYIEHSNQEGSTLNLPKRSTDLPWTFQIDENSEREGTSSQTSTHL